MNQVKKAMILAAGFGLRAQPLSLVKPKALFPVLNRPLISYNLDLLAEIGIKEAAVNTHHLAAQVEKKLAGMRDIIKIYSFHEENILGTGGAVKNAASFLGNEPFILINSAIFTRIDLQTVMDEHLAYQPSVTLVLRDNPRFNNVALDQEGWVRGFRGEWADQPDDQPWRVLAFTGIHVIEPELLAYIPEGPYDIIHSYQAMIKAGARIRALVIEDLPWWKIETRQDYLNVHGDLLKKRREGPVLKGAGVRIEPGAAVNGWACLDQGVVLEAGSMVENSVLWKEARAAAGVKIVDSVLAEGVLAKNDLTGGVKID
ncbi:MAG: NTP transferase domain-containing protein [Deltaproteobacteria bacterium]|nr:NTP transferase domain-containing protein [Deltaproteobacteria bacterium]MBW2051247.1 NTP transferase domain-containing protein [Deltaproteobacteria bacterium]MBW2140315.1 NTP transferase domain-containing protein [Deltaproteobacteria bacterium]MBW2323547.1 NTP transferase domain-containing protein [Deltaproteobacteria bacterium]